MTHPHADHIGGMQAVLDAFPVDRAVLPDFAKAPMPTTSTFLNLLDAIREKFGKDAVSICGVLQNDIGAD